jgi:uncharacterized damage-inducible protein DinB
MTSSLELCRKQRKLEVPKFVAVLKALPPDRLDYRPDPKSRTALAIASLLATEEVALLKLLESGVVEWKEDAPPAGLDEIIKVFENAAAAVNARIDQLDEAGWEKKGRFLMGEGPAWEDGIGDFVWGFLFDEIHHRGQLSTYIRPMGGKVPSIYGPSADESGT